MPQSKTEPTGLKVPYHIISGDMRLVIAYIFVTLPPYLETDKV